VEKFLPLRRSGRRWIASPWRGILLVLWVKTIVLLAPVFEAAVDDLGRVDGIFRKFLESFGHCLVRGWELGVGVGSDRCDIK
jgi:hypothetical protein